MRPSDVASPPPVPPVAAADTGKTGLPSTLGAHDALAILGKNVHSSTGEDMGRLVDVIVDTDGRPRAAIIDFGGFLGVGSRKIAVDWSMLKFVPSDPKGNVITVALTRDQVKAAPEFKEGSPLVALGASASPPPAPPPQAREK
jgi:sporulation protein YlmC with PRC-barrel domain